MWFFFRSPRPQRLLNEIEIMTHMFYASLKESIKYANLCTWFDIRNALSVTSKISINLMRKALEAVKTIFSTYEALKISFWSLVMENWNLDASSSFWSKVDGLKSMSKFVFILNGGTVSWKEFQACNNRGFHYCDWIHLGIRCCKMDCFDKELNLNVRCSSNYCWLSTGVLR